MRDVCERRRGRMKQAKKSGNFRVPGQARSDNPKVAWLGSRPRNQRKPWNLTIPRLFSCFLLSIAIPIYPRLVGFVWSARGRLDCIIVTINYKDAATKRNKQILILLLVPFCNYLLVRNLFFVFTFAFTFGISVIVSYNLLSSISSSIYILLPCLCNTYIINSLYKTSATK